MLIVGVNLQDFGDVAVLKSMPCDELLDAGRVELDQLRVEDALVRRVCSLVADIDHDLMGTQIDAVDLHDERQGDDVARLRQDGDLAGHPVEFVWLFVLFDVVDEEHSEADEEQDGQDEQAANDGTDLGPNASGGNDFSRIAMVFHEISPLGCQVDEKERELNNTILYIISQLFMGDV